VGCLAFSADGRLLASGGAGALKGVDNTIALWDVATGRELRRLIGHQKGVTWVAFTPDGKWLASSEGFGAVRLWRVATGEAIGQMGENIVRLASFGLSADGQSLVCASSSGDPQGNRSCYSLWEVHTGKERLRLEMVNQPAWGFSFAPDGRTLAGGTDYQINLWDLRTGKALHPLQGHDSCPYCVAFSPDGRTLASGSFDTTILLWDMKGLVHLRQQTGDLAPADVQACWDDLASVDASKAYQAIWRLAAAPRRAIPWLRQHLRPVKAMPVGDISELIGKLDSPRFAERQKATRELAELGELAEPALLAALAGKPSLEVRRRLEVLRDGVERMSSPDQRRALRAIEVLEHAGTPEAKQVLETLAQGAAEIGLTRLAKAALARLPAGP
jgi:hypothetical protein